MAKKKPETAPAANAAPEDKLYLHVCSQSGYSMPMSVLLPLTEVGKKTISDAIDDGNKVEIVTKEAFDLLKTSGDNLPQPTDEKHAEVLKLADYEPLIKKTIRCSEYFDDPFTVGEVTQKASEFSEACQRKERLEKELKSHTQYIKSQITEAEATISRLSQDLGRGKTTNLVSCHWVFNEPKHGLKSLYRLDKEPKELIRVDTMTASDRQLHLDDIAAQNGKTERTLEEKEVTPVANEPYEGEMMTDKEVEDETGAKPETETETETETGDEAAESADDSCPI